MSCTNCGQNKSRRHQPTVLVKNVDEQATDLVTEVKQGSFGTQTASSPKPTAQPSPFKPEKPLPENPTAAFEEAKKLSFEDIMQRMASQKAIVDVEINRAYAEMTDAMRHFHILNLLSVANYENMSGPGMSSDQAVVGLWDALSREDFNFINELYPGLKEKVAYRYRELMAKKILL